MLDSGRARREQGGASLPYGMQFLRQRSGVPSAPLAFQAFA